MAAAQHGEAAAKDTWRGGRAAAGTSIDFGSWLFSGGRHRVRRVAGMTIWHERSERSEAQHGGVQRRARAAGQFVERDRRSR
jgi:hypothetical protein